jgi:hypothetical protein
MSNFLDPGTSGTSAATHTNTVMVLASASHTALLQSGNPHYFELFNECMRVKYELEAEKFVFLSFYTFVCYVY